MHPGERGQADEDGQHASEHERVEEQGAHEARQLCAIPKLGLGQDRNQRGLLVGGEEQGAGEREQGRRERIDVGLRGPTEPDGEQNGQSSFGAAKNDLHR